MTHLKSAACFAGSTGLILALVLLHIIPTWTGVYFVGVVWILFFFAGATR